MTLLRVDELTVRFRTEDGPVLAVDAASFDVAAEEVLALVGESGCGKSVTALALTRLLPRNATVAGTVTFDGTTLSALPESALREVRGRDVAYVFQEPMTSLNPVLTVGRQIGEVLRQHQKLHGAAARRRAIELLDLVGIPLPARRIGEYPHQLSGGMRQRVMIAMAVACRPRLLVADEPTTALDVTIQAGILDVLRDLRTEIGMAVLLITHDLGVVAEMCDRVAIMYAGRIVEQADVNTIFRAPQHPYTRALIHATPRIGSSERLETIAGQPPIVRGQVRGCLFAPRCPLVGDDCAVEPALLERASGHGVRCWRVPLPNTVAVPGR